MTPNGIRGPEHHVMSCPLLSPKPFREIVYRQSDTQEHAHFNEILFEIYSSFSFKEMYLKLSSAKCRPFCFVLDMLTRLLRNKQQLGENRKDASANRCFQINQPDRLLHSLSLVAVGLSLEYVRHGLQL